MPGLFQEIAFPLLDYDGSLSRAAVFGLRVVPGGGSFLLLGYHEDFDYTGICFEYSTSTGAFIRSWAEGTDGFGLALGDMITSEYGLFDPAPYPWPGYTSLRALTPGGFSGASWVTSGVGPTGKSGYPADILYHPGLDQWFLSFSADAGPYGTTNAYMRRMPNPPTSIIEDIPMSGDDVTTHSVQGSGQLRLAKDGSIWTRLQEAYDVPLGTGLDLVIRWDPDDGIESQSSPLGPSDVTDLAGHVGAPDGSMLYHIRPSSANSYARNLVRRYPGTPTEGYSVIEEPSLLSKSWVLAANDAQCLKAIVYAQDVADSSLYHILCGGGGGMVPRLRQRQRDDDARMAGTAANHPTSRQGSIRQGHANTYL